MNIHENIQPRKTAERRTTKAIIKGNKKRRTRTTIMIRKAATRTKKCHNKYKNNNKNKDNITDQKGSNTNKNTKTKAAIKTRT